MGRSLLGACSRQVWLRRVSTFMPNPQYENPPVHEVVVAVNFVADLDTPTLQQIQKQLRESSDFRDINPLISSQFIMVSGSPDFPPQLHENQRSFDGWIFRDIPPGRVLRIQRTAFTYHFVRPGSWPKGPYPGWKAILSQYRTFHAILKPYLQDVPIKRIGLRYLNRVAIPENDEPKNWFEIRLESPSCLKNTFAFDIRQTWATVDGDDDISVTVSLKKIEIEDKDLAIGNQGVLLDIDLFNLKAFKAPLYSDVLDWLERAHSLENRVFESCITEKLRANFGGADAASRRDAVR